MLSSVQPFWQLVSDQLSEMLELVSASEPDEKMTEEAITMTHGHLTKYETSLSTEALHSMGSLKETFDRADPINQTPADMCFTGISKLCGVKIWYLKRAERTMFDRIEQHRLLAMLGTPLDVAFAHGIYDLIDLTIESEVEAVQHSTRFPRKGRGEFLTRFKTEMATRLNVVLELLAASCVTQQTTDKQPLIVVKTEMIKAAVTQMNIRLTPMRMQPRLAVHG